MIPTEKFSCYEKWLGRIFFMMAMSISSPAALPADEFSENSTTIGLPDIPLSLEESSLGQPTEQAGDLAWSSEMAFDWKAWAVVGSAGIVLVCVRLFSRRAVFKIPNDVFELLGEATLGGGQSVRIVRFGPKTLLVSLGSGGPKTLSELDDPLATEWIAAACRGEQTLRSLTSRSTVSDCSSDTSNAHVLQPVKTEEGRGSVGPHQSEVA